MQLASLRKRAFKGLAQFLATLAVLLFLPAWSLRYWQGWLFWFEFSLMVTLITLYFLWKDPALIERRLKAGPLAEKQKKQKSFNGLRTSSSSRSSSSPASTITSVGRTSLWPLLLWEALWWLSGSASSFSFFARTAIRRAPSRSAKNKELYPRGLTGWFVTRCIREQFSC
jgi:hypothetical protein